MGWIGTHEGARVWCNVEPCGLICGSLTYLLIGYAMYTTTFAVLLPWMGLSFFGVLHITVFNALALLAGYTHFRTMTTNPGAVPSDAQPLISDDDEFDREQGSRAGHKKFCRRCNGFKPVRAHHCSICRRCIVKMDHHCPWVNNCVGLTNQKLFILFLLYIFTVSVYALVLLIGMFFTCSLNPRSCNVTRTDNLIVIFLLVEALLFGLFTMCMMCDQYSVVASNQTKVDKLKGQKHDNTEDFNEVFGSSNKVRFSWDWLVPNPAQYPEDCRARIFGYTLPGCGWTCEATRLMIEKQQETMPLVAEITSRWAAGPLTATKESIAEEDDAGLLSQVRHRGQGATNGFFMSPTPPLSSDGAEVRPHSN